MSSPRRRPEPSRPTAPIRPAEGPVGEVPAAPPSWAWGGVALLALTGALAAVLESLLVPLYVGTTPLGLAVALAVITNVALPLLARVLVLSPWAVSAPFVLWLVVMIVFGVVTRPEGDVILPGGGLTWVSYGVLLGGALAGMATVVTASPARSPRR